MTIFEVWAFTEVIKLIKNKVIRVGTIPIKWMFRQSHTQRKGHVKTRGEDGCLPAKETALTRKLFHRRLEFGLAASRTGSKEISLGCLNQPVGGALLWQLQQTITSPWENKTYSQLKRTNIKRCSMPQKFPIPTSRHRSLKYLLRSDYSVCRFGDLTIRCPKHSHTVEKRFMICSWSCGESHAQVKDNSECDWSATYQDCREGSCQSEK